MKSTAKTTSTRTAKRQVQTTRINGKRVQITTTAAGIKITPAPVLELDLQIAAVKAIKSLPEYARTAEDVANGKGKFTFAADQNGSGYRSRNMAVKFKAAGMMAGEPDLRFYFADGVLRSMELKAEKGKLTDSQEKRHPLLRALGFEIVVVEASSEDEAASKAVATVRAWLGAATAVNDNKSPDTPWRFASSRA